MKYAVTSAALRTTAGSQTIEISGLGWTPKAAMFVITRATADRTPVANAALSVTYADDAGNVGTVAGFDNDGVTTSDASRYANSGTAAIGLGGSQTIDFVAVVDSADVTAGPVADGWVLDVTTAPGSGYQVVAHFFGGADLSAQVFTGDANATYVVGFTPTLVLASGNGNVLGGAAAVHWITSHGASDGTVERSLHTFSVDNAATSNTGGFLDTSDTTGQLFNSTTQTWAGDVDSFSATSGGQFVATASGHSGDDIVGLALDTGDSQVWVGSVDGPTDAGTGSDWDSPDVGFTPQGVIIWSSMLTAEDSGNMSGTGGTIGIGAHDGTRARAVSVSLKDAVGTTDANSAYAEQFVYHLAEAGTAAFDVEPTSSPFDATGWLVPVAQIAAADSTARKWFAVAFEAESSGGGVTAGGSANLGAITGDGAGAIVISGGGSANLGAITGDGAGAIVISAGGSANLGAITASGEGSIPEAGVTAGGSVNLDAITGSGAGAITVSAGGAATLSSITGSGVGSIVISAGGSATLPAITGDGAGTTAFTEPELIALDAATVRVMGDLLTVQIQPDETTVRVMPDEPTVRVIH